MVGVATRVRYQVLYIRTISIPYGKLDVIIDEELESHMTVLLK